MVCVLKYSHFNNLLMLHSAFCSVNVGLFFVDKNIFNKGVASPVTVSEQLVLSVRLQCLFALQEYSYPTAHGWTNHLIRSASTSMCTILKMHISVIRPGRLTYIFLLGFLIIVVKKMYVTLNHFEIASNFYYVLLL
jgi:hypothetical protein